MRRSGGLVAVAAMLAALMTPVSASADTSPAAAVISPTSGSQVAGFVTVSLTGTVTAGSDTAQRLQLYVDGLYKAEQACLDAVACTASITWDTTDLVGQHTLQARLVTASSAVISAPVPVQVGDPPAASITSPADGTSVRGKLVVNVAGSVDALQPDAVQSLQLLVDGSAVAASSCAAGVKACLASLVWNSTGVQGTHQLQVALTSVKGQTTVSPVVSVLANNPLPTAVLTSPSSMSTVRGIVNVVTVGTVDATQVDTGSSVQLLVDGSSAASVSCTAMRCPAAFPWNTAGEAGIHTLQVLFTTAAGRTALSPITSVWVWSTSTVTLGRLPIAKTGISRKAFGKVTAADGSAVSGALVVVSATSSLGKGNRRATVVTDSRGRFALPYPVVSKTTVSAFAQASTHYGPAGATATGLVTPVTSCTMALRVARGVRDRLTCRLGLTTRGTTIGLQEYKDWRWQNLKAARTTGPTWTWSHAFTAKGIVQVRVVLGASKDFGAVVGKPMRIRVS